MNNLLLGPQRKQACWPEGQGWDCTDFGTVPPGIPAGNCPPPSLVLGRFSKKSQRLSLSAFISRWQTSLENKEGLLGPPQEQRESSEWFPVGQNHSGRQKPYGEPSLRISAALNKSRQIQGQILISAGKLLCFKSAQGCSASGSEQLSPSKLSLQNHFQTSQQTQHECIENSRKGELLNLFLSFIFMDFFFLSEARLPTAANGAVFVTSRGQCLHCTEDRSLSHRGQRSKARSGR